jgi:hypothetical protein
LSNLLARRRLSISPGRVGIRNSLRDDRDRARMFVTFCDLFRNSISTMRDLALHTRSDRLNDATISKLFGERAMRVNGQRMSDANARLPTKMEEFCLPGTRLTLISWGKRKYSAVRWR